MWCSGSAAFVNAGGNPGVNSPGAGQLSVPSTPAAPSTAAIERAAGYVRGQPQQQAGAGPSWRLTFGTPGPGAVVPATPEALTPGTGLSKSAAELYKMYMQMVSSVVTLQAAPQHRAHGRSFNHPSRAVAMSVPGLDNAVLWQWNPYVFVCVYVCVCVCVHSPRPGTTRGHVAASLSHTWSRLLWKPKRR